MVPIGLCSLATVYFIIDGTIRTGKGNIAPEAHEKRLQGYFQSGDYVGAYQFCKANPSPLNNVIRVGVSLLGDGKQATEEGMLGELAKENSRIQTWISYLSVIGVCLDENDKAMDEFIERNRLSWTQIFYSDPNRRHWDHPLVQAYGVHDIPTIWLVNAEGVVVDTHVTPNSLDGQLKYLLASAGHTVRQ